MTYNTVEEFAKWWLSHGCTIRPPFKNPVFTTDIAYSLVLFREGQYQVELYICKPNTSSPNHHHPGVDSFFVYLGGNLEISFDGVLTQSLRDLQKEGPNGRHFLLGQFITHPSSTGHSLEVFDEGGAFLSFEKWNTQEPSSVTVNWAGEPVGEEHQQTIKEHHAVHDQRET
jgi:hypothetical protein